MSKLDQASGLNWIGRIPDAIWGPVAGGLLILIVGLIGLAFGQPWLFPSLGPTAYLQVEQPKMKASRFYNTFVGHMVGMGAGFLGILILNAWNAPIVLSTGELTMPRVGAAAIAVAVTLVVNSLLRASHPPAAATTLLVALGSMQTANKALLIFIGVLILAVLGEAMRQLRVRGQNRGMQKTVAE
jgi:hypothetical protein